MNEAKKMIEDLHAQKLLGEFRGEKAPDKDALIKTLVGLSRIGLELPDVKEIDINPLLIDANGNVTAEKLSGAQTGTAPVFGVRAWANFNAQSNTDVAGTFSRSGTTVTVTVTGHGLIAGNLIFIDFTAGTGTVAPDGLYVVASVTDANVFTVTSAASATGTGTVALRRKTIRASGNISCISASPENPVIPPTSSAFQDDGFYIANFSVAMPDSNFAVFGSCNEGFAFVAANGNDILSGAPYNAQCARVLTISGAGAAVDCIFNSFSVVG